MIEPKLRFKADDGSQFPDWEEKKIGELGTFTKGAPLSKADISECGPPLILYGELYTTYKEVAYNIQRKTQAVVDEKYYSCVGDVIIPTSGESAEDISTATCVMTPGVVLGGDLNIFRSNILDGRIVSYILNHQAKWKIAAIAQGKSIVHIQAKQLSNVHVKYPVSKAEQQKIAEFLSTIDTVIAKQRETVFAWEERKKGVMQKLFSQEVRFKADDGSDFPEWEEKKLGDCCSLITKGTTPKEYPENGDVNFVRIDCIENGSINISKCLKINEQIHNGELARSVLKENDLLCSIAGALGVVTVVTKDVLPANTNQALAILRLYESENVQYISKTLSSYIMEKYIRECKTVGAQPNLSLGQMRDLIIPYPCSEEQQKIADCLSSLDEVIEKQKATLSAWEELKKGLLQQMFV